MPIKYECPECGRRFADWGAENLGFKCPRDENCPNDQQSAETAKDIELVRLGSQDDQLTPRRATTKRTQRRAVDVKPLENQDPEAEPDLDEVDGDFETGDIEADDIDTDDDAAVAFDSDDAVGDADDDSDDGPVPAADDDAAVEEEDGRF